MAITLDTMLELISLRLFIVAVSCILLAVYVIRLKDFYTGTPPGPWGFPIFGYYLMIGDQPFKQFASLSKKYGDVFSFTLGSRYVVVLNHYDSINEAFIKDGDIFAGKPTEGVPAEFGDYKSVFVTEGDVCKEQRRFLINTMKEFGVGRNSMEGYVLEEAKLIIDGLLKSENKPKHLKEIVQLHVTNIISFLVYGERFSKDDKDILDKFNHINDVVTSSSQISVFEAFPILQRLLKVRPSFRTVSNAIKNLYNFSDNKIENHIKYFDIDNIRDIIDAYIMKQKELTSKGREAEQNIYNMSYMRANAVNLFLAGIDTVSGTILWALKLLAFHPEAQKKIQQEIDDVIGQERTPSMNDKLQMPFTESVLLEIQRFVSFVPLTLYHRTTDETYLRGYRIPKHSSVLANLWSVHYDPRIWENPYQFQPDRFLNKDGKISHLRDYMVSFSMGKRNCLGESLAKMEIFLFIVCFLQKLTFHTTEQDTKLECTELPFRKLKSCTLIITPR